MGTRPEDALRLSALVDTLSDTSPINTETKPLKTFTSGQQFVNSLPQHYQKIRFLSHFTPLVRKSLIKFLTFQKGHPVLFDDS
jgi:hypothetical protein